MIVNFKKLDPAAVVPRYAHDGDAGMDICALEEVCVPCGERALVRTGVSIEIPQGCAGLIWGKSGLALVHGITVLGGVIDAGYRGEIKVIILNAGNEDFVCRSGQKIAQILMQKIEKAEIVEVDEFSDSARGDGGFGSTGK